MGFDPVTVATLAIIKGGASIAAQAGASRAAREKARSDQAYLDREAQATREAMRENSRRMREDKARSLAQVRVAQAAAGFGDSGTPLAVFGEIGSRHDEHIEEVTNRSLNQLATLAHKRDMVGFASEQQQKAARFSMFGTAIGTLGKAGFGYRTVARETGKDPFSLLT